MNFILVRDFIGRTWMIDTSLVKCIKDERYENGRFQDVKMYLKEPVDGKNTYLYLEGSVEDVFMSYWAHCSSRDLNMPYDANAIRVDMNKDINTEGE